MQTRNADPGRSVARGQRWRDTFALDMYDHDVIMAAMTDMIACHHWRRNTLKFSAQPDPSTCPTGDQIKRPDVHARARILIAPNQCGLRGGGGRTLALTRHIQHVPRATCTGGLGTCTIKWALYLVCVVGAVVDGVPGPSDIGPGDEPLSLDNCCCCCWRCWW